MRARGSKVERTSSADSRELHVGPALIAAVALGLLGLWLFDLFVLKTSLLANVNGQHALTPLYAIWDPRLRALWSVVPFGLCAAACAALAPRLCDEQRTSGARFVLLLAALGGVLAFTLFFVRETPGALGAQFNVYKDEEFWHDALRITQLPAFVEHYVALMPNLSLHGRHFPPGNAVLLWAVIQVGGPHELAAGVTVLAFAIAALPLAWLALRELCAEHAARQGALLVACTPSFLDFACTSMDAVFLFWAMLALWLALRALRPNARVHDALLGGIALLVATCFSFSAFPLGLVLTAYALVSLKTKSLRPLLAMGAAYAVGALVLWFTTGFALWDCAITGSRLAAEFMGGIMNGRPTADRAHIAYGNPVAFAIGAGVALVAAGAARLRANGLRGARWKIAAVVALAIMSWAPLFYLETERIWLHAIPWLAALALADGALDARSLRRLVWVSLAQAAALESLLFTIW